MNLHNTSLMAGLILKPVGENRSFQLFFAPGVHDGLRTKLSVFTTKTPVTCFTGVYTVYLSKSAEGNYTVLNLSTSIDILMSLIR